LSFSSSPAPITGFSAAREIRQNQSSQVNCKPDVVVSHILVNKNQNQNARDKQAEQSIAPQGYVVVRKPFHQKVHEQNNPWKDE
jgi:CheY-like chemotaxis protein